MWGRETLWPALAALGVVAVLAGLAALKGPFWLGPNLDPDYVYLFNGLLIAAGRAPVHVDHPGTPVQELVAAVLRVAAGGGTDFAQRVIDRPEQYLGMVRGVMLSLLLLTLAWAGAAVARLTRRVGAGLWFAGSVLVTPMVLREALCVKPEPLLLMAGTGMAALVLMAAREAGRRETGWKTAVAMGALAGLAVTSKVTALPLIVVAILGVRGTRARILAVVAMVMAGGVLLIPAYPQLWRLWTITHNIATQGGRYGNGAQPGESFFSAEALRLAETPVLLIALIVAGMGWLARRRDVRLKRDAPPLGAACGTLAVGMALQIALAATQPYEARYLLPGVTLAGAGIIAGVAALRWRIPAWSAAIVLAWAAAAVTDVGIGFAHDMAAHRRDEAFLAAGAAAPDAQVVEFYRASTPAFARFFANSWSGIIFSRECATADPDTVFYNLWGGEGFAGYQRLLPRDAALTSHRLILRGATVEVLPELAGRAGFGRPLAVPGGGLDGLYEQQLPADVTLAFGDYQARGLSRPVTVGNQTVRTISREGAGATLRYAGTGHTRTLVGTVAGADGPGELVVQDADGKELGRVAVRSGGGEGAEGAEETLHVTLPAGSGSQVVRLRVQGAQAVAFRELRIE
ncbi:MAG TPA: hypothetical protein VH253_08900 [Phycisphaerae bacterium]|nr:hypothetical protein [Phycisphaerae bacterium]